MKFEKAEGGQAAVAFVRAENLASDLGLPLTVAEDLQYYEYSATITNHEGIMR
jgi:hypothetical protein